MRYHLRLERDGRWIGGFDCRKDRLQESIEELRPLAHRWQSPVIATRLDGKRRGDTIRIEPELDR